MKLSIIIPVYRVEDTLNRCVESVLNQNLDDFEVILVDDGSPDKCPQMCDDWAKKDAHIQVIHKPNGGLSDARNAGIDIAQGDYLTFVDSDDYVEPEYVETLVNLRNEFDAEMVVTRTVRENEDGSGRPAHKTFESYLADNETALYQIYSGMNVGWAAYGKLLKKSVLLKYPFPYGYYEDCACMYKIIDEFVALHHHHIFLSFLTVG
jgi:glycosyltransferase involved in cell wall biosynthesis